MNRSNLPPISDPVPPVPASDSHDKTGTTGVKQASRRKLAMFDRSLLGPAIFDAFRKLDPRVQARNPVMFVVFIGSLLTTWLWIDALRGRGEAPAAFIGAVSLWLWFGKQMLMTRGALTTFSLANDIAKYFAIIPAAFVTTYPQLSPLNVMGLATPSSAILSAVIFNAVIIIALIPLALKGVRYRAIGAGPLLRRFLLVYGLGGIALPFVGIKLIDVVLVALRLA